MLRQVVSIGVLLVACAHPPAQKTVPSPSTAVAPARPIPVSPPEPAKPPEKSPEFARDVLPILESRCQPCHFAGGKVYDRLPFDRPETIRQLGPKLFTRIKDEPSQAAIRQFLELVP